MINMTLIFKSGILDGQLVDDLFSVPWLDCHLRLTTTGCGTSLKFSVWNLNPISYSFLRQLMLHHVREVIDFLFQRPGDDSYPSSSGIGSTSRTGTPLVGV